MPADPCPARPRRLPSQAPRNVRRSLAFAAALTAGTCILHASPREAHADVSSWFTAGGGYGFQHSDSRNVYDRAGALSFSIGVGSQPTSSVVVGGLLRTTTYFSLGTDLGLSARIASGGFARGQWGLAFDFGPGWRSWGLGADYGRFPLHAMIVGGAPWGLQLGVGGDIWSIDGGTAARGAVAILEIDLLRLTVMRQGATDRWWENPSPAGGRVPPPGNPEALK
jgi:hypothetical protein